MVLTWGCCLQAAEGNGKVAALTSELDQVATHVTAAEEAAESAREGQEIASSSARCIANTKPALALFMTHAQNHLWSLNQVC